MGKPAAPEQIQRVTNDYSESTGIPCWYLSCLHDEEAGGDTGRCTICSLADTCRDVHLLAAYQAERYGGKHIYFCPVSLLHWASPVRSDSMMQGALICGPAAICEPDTYFIDQVNRYAPHPEELISRLDSITMVTPARAESLSNMLLLTALSISDAEGRALYEDRDLFQQQSHISDYLYGLKTMEGDKRSDLDYPLEIERKLMRLTAEGRKQEAGVLLDELIGILLCTTGADLEIIKSRILELVVLLSRSALEGGADAEQIFGINCNYIIKIREMETIDELARWTKRITDRFTDLVFNLRKVRHTQKILQATAYLKKHFHENVSCSEVAASVHLSTSYVSTMFKFEMGMTMTEYLTKLRIDESKHLLLNTSESLGTISLACGFEDQSYFSKVFKRCTGILPSRYRETGGRIIPDDGGIYS